MAEEIFSNTLDVLFNDIRAAPLDKVFTDIKKILIEKGKLYGHEGLRTTAEWGVITRLFDKLFRLKNIVVDNPGVGDPEDTWIDMLGYSILGVLMHRGYFDVEKEMLERVDSWKCMGLDSNRYCILAHDKPNMKQKKCIGTECIYFNEYLKIQMEMIINHEEH